MSEIPVNRRKQLSKVLSVRMTDLEFRHLREILRNYSIKRDSFSECVRVLLSRELHCSRRFRRSQKPEHPSVQPAAQVLNNLKEMAIWEGTLRIYGSKYDLMMVLLSKTLHDV